MRYKDTYGKCKWCGQSRTIMHVPEDYTQAQCDAVATDECDCERAKKERDIRELVDKASTSIAKIVSKRSSDAAAVLQAGASAVAHQYVKKISINVDGALTCSMYMSSGKIIVEARKTEIYTTDGEPEDDPAESQSDGVNTPSGADSEAGE